MFKMFSTGRPAMGLLTVLAISAIGLSDCTRKGKDADNALNVVLSSNVKGLDPIFASDTYSNTVASQIFEGLVHYHFLKRPLELEPLIAEALPKVSEDGLTHTFKIRKGVLFHDSEAFPDGKGREVTAQDFVYSFKRLADPRNSSDGFWIFDGRIKGLNEWRDKVAKGEANYDTPVEGFETPDANTLVIKLIKPYYQLHYVLAMPYAFVVPKEAVEKYGKEFINHPVGTGAFKFESWVRNSQIVLTKNPNWNLLTYPASGEAEDEARGFLADKGKKLPFVDKVVFHEIIEDQPRWLNFMKGNLDYVAVPKDNFDSSIKNDQLTDELKAKGIHLWVSREPDVTYTAFNMKDPVLGKNENLRKAIAYAVDTDTLIQKFYNGRAIVAHSPIPPDVDGYDPAYKSPIKQHDVAKAKEFLAKAGFPEGKGLKPLEYDTTNSSTARQMAEFFKQNLEAAGIPVNIVTSSWPQFTTKLKEQKAQIWGIAWSADYPDAENFLQLLYGKNISPGPNNANYQNKRFDELYEKASNLPPGAERTKLYQEMRDIFAQDLPWVTSAHRLAYVTLHGWLKNYKHHSIINDHLKYLRVDTKARAELKAKL